MNTNVANTATSSQLQRQPQKPQVPATSIGFFNLDGFELMQRIAKAFSTADLVPKQYQGNLANCMIALDMAQRMGANPLQVMQNLYIVHGTPGLSAKFLIATINTCGRYSTLRYEWAGEKGTPEYGCRAWAIERETGERLDGIWVDWAMVNAEGWASKNGSKWKTMPDQMFIYRAAAFWQRAYAPDLGMGLQTQEEIHDVYEAGRGANGEFSVDIETLRTAERTDKQAEQQPKTLDHQPGETLNTTTGEIKQADPEPAQKEKAQTKQRQQAKPDPEPEKQPDQQGYDDFDME